MGFALAALVLHEITPSWDHGGSQEYFSVATRLQAILDNTPLDENDELWVLLPHCSWVFFGSAPQSSMLHPPVAKL
jgi:hypothetical protein